MKPRLLLTALVIAGLAGSTFTADAKSKKPHKASDTTTGMSSGSKATKGTADQSPSGNVGPGTTNNGATPGGTKN